MTAPESGRTPALMKAEPVAAALVVLFALTSGVSAQSPESSVPAADRTAIASCLGESGESPRTCIGTIAVVCGRQGDNRDESRISCTRREAAVWRERLDFALQTLSQRLDSGLRNRLASVQRGWEAYAPQKCALMAELQAPAQASAVQAGCDLRETAVRSIEVERLARRQAQSASPRPRIER